MRAVRRMYRQLPYKIPQGYFPGHTQAPIHSQYGNYSNPYMYNSPYIPIQPVGPAVQPVSPTGYQGTWPNPASYSQQMAYATPSNQQQLTPNQLLQNPLVQSQQNFNPLFQMPPIASPFLNPYPKQQMLVKQKPGGSILNSFKSQDGSIDLNKMINTAGQMMHAVQQVSSMVKGLGSMFKV